MPLPHQKIPLITFFLRLQPEFQVIPEVTANSRPVRILPFEFLNNLSYPAAESSKALGLSNPSANKVKENFAAHFLSPPSKAISNKTKTYPPCGFDSLRQACGSWNYSPRTSKFEHCVRKDAIPPGV
jgi:hypothetical protein